MSGGASPAFKNILASLPAKEKTRESLLPRFVQSEELRSWFGDQRHFSNSCSDFCTEVSVLPVTVNEDEQLFRNWISHLIADNIVTYGARIDPADEYLSIQYLIYLVLREVNWSSGHLIDLFALAQQVFSRVFLSHNIDAEGRRYMTPWQLRKAVRSIQEWMI